MPKNRIILRRPFPYVYRRYALFIILLIFMTGRPACTASAPASLAISSAGGFSCFLILAHLDDDRNYDGDKDCTYQDRSPV